MVTLSKLAMASMTLRDTSTSRRPIKKLAYACLGEFVHHFAPWNFAYATTRLASSLLPFLFCQCCAHCVQACLQVVASATSDVRAMSHGFGTRFYVNELLCLTPLQSHVFKIDHVSSSRLPFQQIKLVIPDNRVSLAVLAWASFGPICLTYVALVRVHRVVALSVLARSSFCPNINYM